MESTTFSIPARRCWMALLLMSCMADGLVMTSVMDAQGLPDGITIEAALTVDAISNLSGGEEQGTEVMSNIDLIMALDLEALCSWRGGSFSLYLLGDHGSGINDLVGSFQGVDNIEAPDADRVYELWLEQALWGDRGSLRLGLYDLNSEFDAIETAGIFLNPSHGIGPDLSQTGANGPSIFPVTSVALRAQFAVNRRLGIRAVVLDAVSGDPKNSSGTHIRFESGDGVLAVVEADFDLNPGGSLRRAVLGVWGYSEEVTESAAGVAIEGQRNQGWYVLGELAFNRGFLVDTAVFARFGMTNADVNLADAYLGFGAVRSGALVAGDQLGLAVGAIRVSEQYRREMAAQNSAVDQSEVIIELSYGWPATDWLTLQPDLQYVINPGADPSLDSALVAGLRAILSFGLN